MREGHNSGPLKKNVGEGEISNTSFNERQRLQQRAFNTAVQHGVQSAAAMSASRAFLAGFKPLGQIPDAVASRGKLNVLIPHLRLAYHVARESTEYLHRPDVDLSNSKINLWKNAKALGVGMFASQIATDFAVKALTSNPRTRAVVGLSTFVAKASAAALLADRDLRKAAYDMPAEELRMAGNRIKDSGVLAKKPANVPNNIPRFGEENNMGN